MVNLIERTEPFQCTQFFIGGAEVSSERFNKVKQCARSVSKKYTIWTRLPEGGFKTEVLSLVELHNGPEIGRA